MIKSFIESWALFQNTYLAGWAVAVALALVGVLTVARDQIFIGAAVTESSTLGIAVAFWMGTAVGTHDYPWMHTDLFLSVMAVGFSMLGTLLTARAREAGRESHEAVTGWVFLVSASGSVLLVAHSPHGLEEIHRTLASSIIGATATDVWVFATLAALSAAALWAFRRTILLIALDAPMAQASGIRTGVWSVGIALWTGLLVGLAIRVSGTLYTFGCLVLPALAAKNLCREVRPLLWAAPVIAFVAALVAFVVANHYDYPPAQMTVALLCLALALGWGVRHLKKRLSHS